MGSLRDRLQYKADQNRIPYTAAFELLPVCNLQCKMCYVRKSMSEVNAAGGLKDADWWLEIAEQASQLGLIYPLLTGGEPFLHPQFFEIMAGLEKLGMQTSINSNGTMIDRDTACWLGKHRPLRINITLYGATEKSYQDLCGHGEAYEKVCKGVEFLRQYHVPVKFNASITPQNVNDLEKIVEYARECNAPLQVATYMFPPIRRDSKLIGKNDRLTPEEAALARVKTDYLQLKPEAFAAQAIYYNKFIPLEKIKNTSADEAIGMICRAGVSSVWIDWRGRMTNCGMYNSAVVELKNRTFAEAWKELTDRTSRIRYMPYCAVCPNRKICHTCIAMVSNECGTVNGRPEYMCRMNQAMADFYTDFLQKYYPDIANKAEFSELPVVNRDICEL